MKLTPEYRFPEFKNDGDWDGDSLINIAKFRRGSFPQPYGLPEWYDDENGMPFIQVYDVDDNFRLKQTTKRKISELAAAQSVFIEKGTVIITIQGSIGRVAITQYDAYIDRTLLIFQEFYNNIDKTFFAYILFLLFEIEKLKAPGGIIKTITKEVLSDFVVSFPKVQEQQKIASCLSSLDELIAAHNDKLDALKDHKKGLLQNLFPQEGETVPKVRFPDFANNGKWDNKPISKLGETVNGLSGKKGADFGSGRPYVQYKQVFDKSFIDFTECGKVDVGENENQNQLQLGDILFTTSSETPDEVGFASVINKQPEEPTYLNSFCFILRPNDLNEINPGFSRYLFHSPIYRKSVSAIAQGSTRYNLSKKAFLKLRVPVPSTPEEQQKIASCLSAVDELITAQQEKIEQLQQHKKGLMQGLFPKIES